MMYLELGGVGGGVEVEVEGRENVVDSHYLDLIGIQLWSC